MMFKGSGAQGDLNGFLDAGSHMTGELHFEDTFRIDGKFTGNVVSDGDLIVGERGDVDGEIRVCRVFVSGSVRGALRATERVEITASGKVKADVQTPSLTIDDGAFFEGRCSMEPSQKPSGAAAHKKVAQMPMVKRAEPKGLA